MKVQVTNSLLFGFPNTNEEIEVDDAATAKDLLLKLQEKYNFDFIKYNVSVVYKNSAKTESASYQNYDRSLKDMQRVNPGFFYVWVTGGAMHSYNEDRKKSLSDRVH